MRPANEYHDTRRMLVRLLKQPGDGPVSIVDLSDRDKEFLKATCTVTVLLYQICHMAGFSAADAVEGFAALTTNIDKTIYSICDEELPDAPKN